MKTPYFSWIALAVILAGCEPDRVAQAKSEKMAVLESKLAGIGVNPAELKVFFRGFKREKVLEAWVKNARDSSFALLGSYPICEASGELGPKLREGDRQVPEGVYRIDRFNAKSKFHLSLGLNYPNESDRLRADQTRPGGDIFIHGGCASIGCLAMTDDLIKEIYVLALMAKDAGQASIEVHLFPTRLTDENLRQLQQEMPTFSGFYAALKPIFDSFENERQLPFVTVDTTGAYRMEGPVQ
ncbi:MAG: L,D-transpeptidase family protein [Saprospiraceae bacterium]|jgi:murein L,D-transpeptidase YafK|nr:L,D-transpeptidase family protein [Saprospiraceae bacterium]